MKSEAGEIERRFAARLASVVMGIDALARRPGAVPAVFGEVKVVPLFNGGALIEPRDYVTWEDAAADVADLDPEALPAGPRRAFSVAMRASMRAALRMFCGETLTFSEKMTELVGAPADPAAWRITAQCHEAIDLSLRRLGFVSGDLAVRLAAWEAARAVAPGDVAGLFKELCVEAKRRTTAHIFDTGDYAMELTPVHGVTYTARCGFSARRVQLNMDIAFTRAALKQLVCHEIFPGHATQMLSTRAAAEEGRSGHDALLCAANAAPGCVQEGIGDQAAELIGWIEDEDDVLYGTLKRLRNAEQAAAAWRLMEEGGAEADVARELKTRAFGQDAWIKGRLAMARHPFNGPFITSYFAGDECVRTLRARLAPAELPAFTATLFEDVHSLSSLGLFGARDPVQTA